MTGVILGIVALVLGILLLARPHLIRISRFGSAGGYIVGLVGVVAGLGLLASSSFVVVDANAVGHLKRIYAFEDMEPGQIIATDGQKGPQARILGPGFHLIPLVRVLYDFEEWDPVITIPEGYYGQLTARWTVRPHAGRACSWPRCHFRPPNVGEMLNAATFLDQWRHASGPQETVLKPGQYRLNRYLFDVNVWMKTPAATIIPAGHVGVVKSNVSQPDASIASRRKSATHSTRIPLSALTVPLVPRRLRRHLEGRRCSPAPTISTGNAYEVTLVDTRVQTWEYKGGYTKRIIDLSVDQQGNIQQKRTLRAAEQIDGPERRRSGGLRQGRGLGHSRWNCAPWCRSDPDNAPVVVGSVGGLGEIENRILTPAIRSIVRNVAGASEITRARTRTRTITVVQPASYTVRPTRVLDLIEKPGRAGTDHRGSRSSVEGNKAGVDIREIRLGEPARFRRSCWCRGLRVQLADQLSHGL